MTAAAGDRTGRWVRTVASKGSVGRDQLGEHLRAVAPPLPRDSRFTVAQAATG
jgi:hypothetical protein